MRHAVVALFFLIVSSGLASADGFVDVSGGGGASGGGGTNPARTGILTSSCTGVAAPCYTDLQTACTGLTTNLTGTNDATLLIYPGVYTVTPAGANNPGATCEGLDVDRRLNVIGMAQPNVLDNSGVIITANDGVVTGNPTVRTLHASWSGVQVMPGNDASDIAMQIGDGAGGFGEVHLFNMLLYQSTTNAANAQVLLDVTNTSGSGIAVVFAESSTFILSCGTCNASTAVIRHNVTSSSLNEIRVTNSFVEFGGIPNAESMLFDVQGGLGNFEVVQSQLDSKQGEVVEADEDDVVAVVFESNSFRTVGTAGTVNVIGQLINVDDTTPDAVSPVEVTFADNGMLTATPTAADDYGTNAIVTWSPGTVYARTDAPPTCVGAGNYERAGLMYFDVSQEVLCVCNGSVWERLDTGADGTNTNCEAP